MLGRAAPAWQGLVPWWSLVGCPDDFVASVPLPRAAATAQSSSDSDAGMILWLFLVYAFYIPFIYHLCSLSALSMHICGS